MSKHACQVCFADRTLFELRLEESRSAAGVLLGKDNDSRRVGIKPVRHWGVGAVDILLRE